MSGTVIVIGVGEAPFSRETAGRKVACDNPVRGFPPLSTVPGRRVPGNTRTRLVDAEEDPLDVEPSKVVVGLTMDVEESDGPFKSEPNVGEEAAGEVMVAMMDRLQWKPAMLP